MASSPLKAVIMIARTSGYTAPGLFVFKGFVLGECMRDPNP